MAFEKLRRLSKRGKVLLNLRSDVGPLDFNYDRTAIVQGRPMHLAQRGRRHWLFFKIRKSLVDLRAEFGFDREFHVLERERLYFILKPRQRLYVGRWQQIGPAGEQLAQFDERRSKTFEVT